MSQDATRTGSHEALAARLRAAYSTGAVPPLRDGLAPADGAGAYSVQAINTRYWLASGRRIIGRKIGLTAGAVQAQLGVDQPDYGVLFDDMRIENGGTLRATMWQPKVEAEVALIMAEDLNDPSPDAAAVAAAVAYVSPAIEIVDSRITDWKISFADTVADNGSSAFFVLGDERRMLDEIDLVGCTMELAVNAAVTSRGSGASCLGNPLNAAAWLAKVLAATGEPLKAGDIVLTGALGPMTPITPGDAVSAEIAGLGGCSFTYASGDR